MGGRDGTQSLIYPALALNFYIIENDCEIFNLLPPSLECQDDRCVLLWSLHGAQRLPYMLGKHSSYQPQPPEASFKCQTSLGTTFASWILKSEDIVGGSCSWFRVRPDQDVANRQYTGQPHDKCRRIDRQKF